MRSFVGAFLVVVGVLLYSIYQGNAAQLPLQTDIQYLFEIWLPEWQISKQNLTTGLALAYATLLGTVFYSINRIMRLM